MKGNVIQGTETHNSHPQIAIATLVNIIIIYYILIYCFLLSS